MKKKHAIELEELRIKTDYALEVAKLLFERYNEYAEEHLSEDEEHQATVLRYHAEEALGCVQSGVEDFKHYTKEIADETKGDRL